MALPVALAPIRDNGWSRIEALAGPESFAGLGRVLDTQGLRAEFEQLLATSRFITEQAGRHSDWLQAALSDGSFLASHEPTQESWDNRLVAVTGDVDTEVEFMSALRRFRQREMLRLIWRDFTRRGDLNDTLTDVTHLADACVRAAVQRARCQLAPRYGQPIGAQSGAVQDFVVLGLGKLGGGELNVSSDIDLIFAYPEAGETCGGRDCVSNQEFFIKQGQTVIRLLDAVTPDGFVFRVDMRLRPYGDSGALVCNYDALELYYQEQGRDWERYAMMKARPITGSAAALTPLLAMFKSFIYRRYTDFGVVDSLRAMKGMITAETLRQNLTQDIKKGAGGIREIEFITQCLQLIYGGRNSQLQLRGTVEALHALADEALLPLADVTELLAAYQFARNCEHGLQGMADTQTQRLPDDPLAQLQLAVIMGQSDWSSLATLLDHHRARVSYYFAGLVAPPVGDDSPSDSPLLLSHLSADTLEDWGFADSAASWSAIEALWTRPRMQFLEGESHQRMARFLPRLCEAAAATGAADTVLLRLLPLVEAVSRRSAYLVLLEENPRALGQLAFLAAKSPWIADKLATRPDLLDELLDSERLYHAPTRAELHSELRQQLLRIPEDDLEQQMYTLGRIKDATTLRVAASELTGRLPVMKVSDNLTFLAEVIVEHALYIARTELVRRYGEPQQSNHVDEGMPGFAVLAYGKFGGIEMGYDSDLDLVFVFDGGRGETTGPRVADNIRFFTRLAQRVVHILDTRQLGGRLYEVDLRLRPNGDSGLIAVSLTGFKKYQDQSAWTWEHQALVRARVVAGDAALIAKLATIRADVLMQQRVPSTLVAAIIDMRLKMSQALTPKTSPKPGQFDLKYAVGGIVDIEFVVQYLVLAHAQNYPALTQWSDVVRLLETLAESGLLAQTAAEALRLAYLAFRSAQHDAGLQGVPAHGSCEQFVAHRQHVVRLRDQILPGLPGIEAQ